MSIEIVKRLVSEAVVYIPEGCEAIRIESHDLEEGCFQGVGEESGENYQVELDEVNLDNDMFYKMVLMENK